MATNRMKKWFGLGALFGVVALLILGAAAPPKYMTLAEQWWTNDAGILHLKTNATVLGLGDTNTFIALNVGGSFVPEDQNLSMGYQSANSYTGGDRNSMFGNLSGASITTGDLNAGFGYSAMQWMTDGANNVALGPRAMQFCTNGNQNTGVGLEALQHIGGGGDNCAFGWDCLDFAIGSTFMSAFGSESLHSVEQGCFYTSAFGYRSGFNERSATTRTFNTFLGALADHNGFAGTETNATAVGYRARVTANNQVMLGNLVVKDVTTSGNYSSKAGQGSSNVFLGGTYFQQIGTAFTNLNGTPSTLTNLGTVSISGHTLTNNGDRLVMEAGIQLQIAKANTNRFQIFWGSSTLLDTGLQIASNSPVRLGCTIARTGNTSAHVEAWLTWGPSAVPFVRTNANLEIAETNGIDTLLGIKGAAQAVGAHTNNYFVVEWKPGSR